RPCNIEAQGINERACLSQSFLRRFRLQTCVVPTFEQLLRFASRTLHSGRVGSFAKGTFGLVEPKPCLHDLSLCFRSRSKEVEGLSLPRYRVIELPELRICRS